jgi:hypothetical protein
MRYSDVSHWLATSGDLSPRPALVGDHDVDVVIVGAGFTGLWTAWYLQQREPTLRIAICEAQIAGYGASGRNGAWCSAGIGMTAAGLARRYDAATARDVIHAMRATVDEIGRVCHDAGIDAEFHKGGMLRVARGDHEVTALRAGMAEYRRLGLDRDLIQLSAADLDARVRAAAPCSTRTAPRCIRVIWSVVWPPRSNSVAQRCGSGPRSSGSTRPIMPPWTRPATGRSCTAGGGGCAPGPWSWPPRPGPRACRDTAELCCRCTRSSC